MLRPRTSVVPAVMPSPDQIHCVSKVSVALLRLATTTIDVKFSREWRVRLACSHGGVAVREAWQ